MTPFPYKAPLHACTRARTHTEAPLEEKWRHVASLASLVSPAGPATSADIERLADAVRALAPCHRNPERFHMDKAAIAGELRELARRLRPAR
jgi:hypothetical protein